MRLSDILFGYFRENQDVPTIEPSELRDRMESEELLLLDCRRPDEHAYCRIEPSVLIPLHELEQRLSEVDQSRPVIVYCHHANRSAHAVRILQAAGHEDVCHLAGGIEAWSTEIDPSVPRY